MMLASQRGGISIAAAMFHKQLILMRFPVLPARLFEHKQDLEMRPLNHGQPTSMRLRQASAGQVADLCAS